MATGDATTAPNGGGTLSSRGPQYVGQALPMGELGSTSSRAGRDIEYCDGPEAI